MTVWGIAKWPVLAARRRFMISLLYWAGPNVKQPGFPWVTPGGLLAVLLWIVASALFAFYVANFASYNKTYGSLGGVIVFLIWLWITNNVITARRRVQLRDGAQAPDPGRPPARAGAVPAAARHAQDEGPGRGVRGPARAAAHPAARDAPAALGPLTTPGFRRTRCNGSCRFSGCGCPYPRSSAPPRPAAGLPPSRPITPPKDSAVMRTAAFIHLTGVTQPTSGTGGSRAGGIATWSARACEPCQGPSGPTHRRWT